MDTLVLRLLQEIVETCGAAEATYWAAADNGAQLRAAVNAGPAPAKLEGLLVPVDGSLVGMVFCTGLATAVGPDAPYHPAAMAATGVPTEAMAAAPVRVRGQTAGVLSTINPEGRTAFSPEDLERVRWKAFVLGCILEHFGHGV